MLEDQPILVTGGTGSLGKAFAGTVFSRIPNIKRLVVFSRDELKQYEMEQAFSTADYPGLRSFIGGMRDYNRRRCAVSGIDTVFRGLVAIFNSGQKPGLIDLSTAQRRIFAARVN